MMRVNLLRDRAESVWSMMMDDNITRWKSQGKRVQDNKRNGKYKDQWSGLYSLSTFKVRIVERV
jgi:hypothetical protein